MVEFYRPPEEQQPVESIWPKVAGFMREPDRVFPAIERYSDYLGGTSLPYDYPTAVGGTYFPNQVPQAPGQQAGGSGYSTMLAPGVATPFNAGQPQEDPLQQLLSLTQKVSWTGQLPGGGPVVQVHATPPKAKKGVGQQGAPQQGQPQGMPQQAPQQMPQQQPPREQPQQAPPMPQEANWSGIYQPGQGPMSAKEYMEKAQRIAEGSFPTYSKAMADAQAMDNRPRWRRIADAVMSGNPFIGDQIVANIAQYNLTRGQAIGKVQMDALIQGHNMEQNQMTQQRTLLAEAVKNTPNLARNRGFIRDWALLNGIPEDQAERVIDGSFDKKTGTYNLLTDHITAQKNSILAYANMYQELDPTMSKEMAIGAAINPGAYASTIGDKRKDAEYRLGYEEDPDKIDKLEKTIHKMKYLESGKNLSMQLQERLEMLKGVEKDWVTGPNATASSKHLYYQGYISAYESALGVPQKAEGAGGGKTEDPSKTYKRYLEIKKLEDDLGTRKEKKREAEPFKHGTTDRILIGQHPETRKAGHVDEEQLSMHRTTQNSMRNKVMNNVNQGKPMEAGLTKDEKAIGEKYTEQVRKEAISVDPKIVSSMGGIQNAWEASVVHRALEMEEGGESVNWGVVASEIKKRRENKGPLKR